MRSVIILVMLAILLAILIISLGQNADEPGPAVAIGVIFGVATAIPVGFGIALYRRDNAPSQPRQYITHQHLHVYRVDAAGEPELLDEQTRTLTTTR